MWRVCCDVCVLQLKRVREVETGLLSTILEVRAIEGEDVEMISITWRGCFFGYDNGRGLFAKRDDIAEVAYAVLDDKRAFAKGIWERLEHVHIGQLIP